MIEWNYAHDADITIGEVHISKTAKILLICLIVFLVIVTGVAIYFRAYIYDYIANPTIILTEKEVNIEVHEKFNAENYIANDTSNYTYEIVNSDFDVDKLGTYIVTYNSSNRVNKNTVDLTVNVVDTTPPEIILTKELDLLVRGKDTKHFNPVKYIKSIKDNYSSKDKIKIDYTTDIDFSKDTAQIIYKATDENNNVSTKTLNLAIYNSAEDLEKDKDNKTQTTENNTSNSNNSQTEAPVTEEYTEAPTEAPQTEAPTEVPTEAPTEAQTEAPAPITERSISGVHDVTYSWSDTSWTLQSAYSDLAAGVSCTGDSIYLEGYSGQIAGPGTYAFTWRYSSDGSSPATCYLYVTE